MALTDLSVELADDSGSPIDLHSREIATKFIKYYWRQTVPYIHGDVLKQNSGDDPVVVKRLLKVRSKYQNNLLACQREPADWEDLVAQIADKIRDKPLRHLQNVGGTTLAFLYADHGDKKAPEVIRLLPGTAYCFRRFRGLIAELVQAAWARWIQQKNVSLVRENGDLHEFLFGAERERLARLQEPLRHVQKHECFYCRGPLRGEADVDHFVPWSLYQFDLGHNLVVAHKKCNSEKSDRLASESHVARWVEQNRDGGTALCQAFDKIGIPHNLSATMRIAWWAYSSLSLNDGLTWVSKNTLVPLSGEWKSLLGVSTTDTNGSVL
jgi:5-methylcytosine-specific restriction endonuclease McrA